MKSKLGIFSLIIIAITLLSAVPNPAEAGSICCDGPNAGNSCVNDTTCGIGYKCGGLCNPLGSTKMSLIDLWVRILQLMLGAVGLFAVMMFIYGGFVMLTSGGNPDKVKKAKDTLVWATLGLATIVFSGAAVRYLFTNFTF
ncbi:pilin [Patescibacteria group bacterium]|nr:pilin [Patescibacteria group bacterium]MBU1074928.1 pilin [Patescibacteria group bacterium]MBU1951327.1 pilin [Patescibacteria group bacterium]MBU2235440.1 pilin [Patescibacteria group bacterium]